MEEFSRTDALESREKYPVPEITNGIRGSPSVQLSILFVIVAFSIILAFTSEKQIPFSLFEQDQKRF
jgi:hypothetical protein